jgi:hypothetical protein
MEINSTNNNIVLDKRTPKSPGSGSGGDPLPPASATSDSVTLSDEAKALALFGSGSGGDPA